MSVKLNIKNPSTQVDFPITISLSETVADLKRVLHAQYPSNPEPHKQKLIYLGKLLQDDNIFSNLFARADVNQPQTVHLIISRATVQEQPSSPNPIPAQLPNQFTAMYPNQFPGQFPPQIPRQFPPQQFPQQPIPQPFPPQQFPQQAFPQQPFPPQVPVQVPVHGPAPPNNNNGGGLGLVFKLGILMLIFVQDGGSLKLVFLLVTTFVLYLYLTSRLQIQIHRYNPRRRNPANPGEGENGNENQVEQEKRGVIGEITDIVIPFFSSLSPTWNPRDIMEPGVPHVPDANQEPQAAGIM